LLRPGERVTLSADEARRLTAEGFVRAIPKTIDAPPKDKMLHRPMAKKGQE
jgi:hypothetical protein